MIVLHRTRDLLEPIKPVWFQHNFYSDVFVCKSNYDIFDTSFYMLYFVWILFLSLANNSLEMKLYVACCTFIVDLVSNCTASLFSIECAVFIFCFLLKRLVKCEMMTQWWPSNCVKENGMCICFQQNLTIQFCKMDFRIKGNNSILKRE